MSENNNQKPSGFRRLVENMSERTWRIWQAIVGVAIGTASCVFLYGGNGGFENQWSTVYALLLALVVPKLIEQSCGRSVLFGKTVMLVTIIIGLLVVFLSWGFRTGFSFSA